MRTFEVAPGPHAPMLAVQAYDLTLAECLVLRGIVTNQYMLSDDYKFSKDASVFLQGYREPFSKEGTDGWVLLEFWTDNKKSVEAFVDYINKKINDKQELDLHTLYAQGD